ncbi:MAG: hypothetical protein H6613_11350 [Ignavibacteriales bacterium]|nr:hypothetical protein [Ignavibacteriales bacterium]
MKPDLMAMGSGTYAAGNGSNSSYRSNFDGTSASCFSGWSGNIMLEKDYSLTPIAIREILKIQHIEQLLQTIYMDGE